MIHIITVHWETDFWIPIQLAKLRAHTDDQYRIYSFYSGFDPGCSTEDFYFFSKTEIKDHSSKLNILARKVIDDGADPDDLLVFIDSDAFPIKKWDGQIRELLKKHPLVAVRRNENLGDIQPHPCFCATTIGFWNKINGDWQRGFEWKDISGKVRTDVGGNLLKLLIDNKVDWFPLLRSNKVDLHPIFFAVYGDLIYHHGAGSRSSGGKRVDNYNMKNKYGKAWNVFKLFRLDKIMRKWSDYKIDKTKQRVLDKIIRDPDFYKIFEN